MSIYHIKQTIHITIHTEKKPVLFTKKQEGSISFPIYCEIYVKITIQYLDQYMANHNSYYMSLGDGVSYTIMVGTIFMGCLFGSISTIIMMGPHLCTSVY